VKNGIFIETFFHIAEKVFDRFRSFFFKKFDFDVAERSFDGKHNNIPLLKFVDNQNAPGSLPARRIKQNSAKFIRSFWRVL
jgi:hypothetical protein